MKIKQAEIVNYRSCVKTKVTLSKNLTALIGINGVGKSNILNALLLLKQVLHNNRFYRRGSNKDLLKSKINFKIELDDKIIFLNSILFYETDENNVDEVYSAEMKFRVQGSANPRKWTRIDSETLEVISYVNRYKNSDILETRRFQTENMQIAIKLLSSLLSINYYSATQFSNPSLCPVSIELDDDRLTRSYGRSATHDTFIFDLYKSFVSKKKKSFNLFLNTVNQNGIELIDDLTFLTYQFPSSTIKVKSGGQIQKIEKSKKIVVPSVTVDELKLSPHQLSEGTFKSMALVFYILSDQSDILLIEEPEVCVHHGLLNSLIELIKIQSKKKQIIISTHSDYVLDKLKPENVLLIRKERGEGTTGQRLSKSLSKDDYSALKEYLKETGNLGEYWKEGGFGYE